jgi:hypothetical protein
MTKLRLSMVVSLMIAGLPQSPDVLVRLPSRRSRAFVQSRLV